MNPMREIRAQAFLAVGLLPLMALEMPEWLNMSRAALLGFSIIIPLTLTSMLIAMLSKKGKSGFAAMFFAGLAVTSASVILMVFLAAAAEKPLAADGLGGLLQSQTPFVWLGMMFTCGVLWQLFIGFDSGYRDIRKPKPPPSENQRQDVNGI